MLPKCEDWLVPLCHLGVGVGGLVGGGNTRRGLERQPGHLLTRHCRGGQASPDPRLLLLLTLVPAAGSWLAWVVAVTRRSPHTFPLPQTQLPRPHLQMRDL